MVTTIAWNVLLLITISICTYLTAHRYFKKRSLILLLPLTLIIILIAMLIYTILQDIWLVQNEYEFLNLMGQLIIPAILCSIIYYAAKTEKDNSPLKYSLPLIKMPKPRTRAQRIICVYGVIWLSFWLYIFANSIYFEDKETFAALISSPLMPILIYKTYRWVQSGDK